MKKRWEEPMILVQQFVANEYVAACGDSGTVYNFECNAGTDGTTYNVFWENGTPYASSNNNDEWSAPFSGYHPCHQTHEADSDSGFGKGYMYKQYWGGLFNPNNGNNTGDRIDVIIWTDNNTDVHCTTNLVMNSWTTAKS